MVGQDHVGRNADEERLDVEGVAVLLRCDGDNSGGRFAVHEAGEQGEVVVIAASQRLEGVAVGGGDVGAHGRLPYAAM